MASKNENVRHGGIKIDGELCDHISVVAMLLGVSTTTVKTMIQKGQLKGTKVAEGYWVTTKTIEKLLWS